jgi:hypothetical protein
MSKSQTIKWTVLKKQSLQLAAREAGYDLTMFEDYPKAVQETLRFHAIKNVLYNLRTDFEDEEEKELWTVTQGVYVICLSDPFTIQYGLSCSNVIYIGRGKISSRLENHFKYSLFDVMMSLAGADFDFYLSEPIDKNEEGYFKQLEHDLLANFRTKIGGGTYPLLNKYAGSNQGLELGAGWNLPLKTSGKRPTWAIKPTGKRPIRELD